MSFWVIKRRQHAGVCFWARPYVWAAISEYNGRFYDSNVFVQIIDFRSFIEKNGSNAHTYGQAQKQTPAKTQDLSSFNWMWWVSELIFALVFLFHLVLGMVMVVLEALELALLGVVQSDSEGSDARREGSYSDDWCGIFFFLCLLASLGADSPFTLGVALGRLGRCAAAHCAARFTWNFEEQIDRYEAETLPTLR